MGCIHIANDSFGVKIDELLRTEALDRAWKEAQKQKPDKEKICVCEAKVILTAIAEIVAKSDSIEEIYDSLTLLASAEGVTLAPLSERRKKKGDTHDNI